MARNLSWAALAHPGVKGVLFAQLLARLPLGMNTVALLLHTQAVTGDIALAGGATAVMALFQAVAQPVSSRALGRFGTRPVLAVTSLTGATALVLFAVVPPHPLLLLLLAAIAGVSLPPTSTVARIIYPTLVPARDLKPLFSVDSVTQELIWIVGPLLVAVIAAVASTPAALVTCAVVLLAGQTWFALNPLVAGFRPAPSLSRIGGVLGDKRLVLVLLVAAGLIGSVGAIEVGAVAFAADDRILVGAIVGSLAVGSVTGGLLLGPRRTGRFGLVVLSGLAMVFTIAAVFAPNVGILMLVLLLAGLGHAPSLAIAYTLVIGNIRSEGQSEAFGWMMTASLLGSAGGAALAGIVARAGGAPAAFLVGGSVLLLSVGSALVLAVLPTRPAKSTPTGG